MKKISRENMIKLLDEIRSIIEKEIELSSYSEEISFNHKIRVQVSMEQKRQ